VKGEGKNLYIPDSFVVHHPDNSSTSSSQVLYSLHGSPVQVRLFSRTGKQALTPQGNSDAPAFTLGNGESALIFTADRFRHSFIFRILRTAFFPDFKTNITFSCILRSFYLPNLVFL
jgi:hypothetical protein